MIKQLLFVSFVFFNLCFSAPLISNHLEGWRSSILTSLGKDRPSDVRVFVAGGSKGIGKEYSLLFSRMGFDVTIAASSDAVFATAEELSGEGRSVMPVKVDLGRDNALDVIKNSVSDLSDIDILIYSAGIELFDFEKVHNGFEQQLEKMVRIKTQTAYELSSEIGRSRQVVNKKRFFHYVSSVSAIIDGIDQLSLYSESNKNIWNVAKQIKSKFGDIITVSTVFPGFVKTDLLERSVQKRMNFFNSNPVVKLLNMNPMVAMTRSWTQGHISKEVVRSAITPFEVVRMSMPGILSGENTIPLDNYSKQELRRKWRSNNISNDCLDMVSKVMRYY